MDFNPLYNFLIEYSKNKSIKSYEFIKEVIYNYQFPFPTFTIPIGEILYRGRINKSNEIYFEDLNDFTNIKDIEKIQNYGRANEPRQSIFYCSTNKDTAYFEVSKISRQNCRPKFEYTTMGVWSVQKDLRVGVIPIHSEIKDINIIAKNLYNKYVSLIKDRLLKGIEIPLKLLDFISNEFFLDAKNIESNYVLSCAFANYMYDTKGNDSFLKRGTELDGIFYSSVQHKDEGMNLALKPEVVETHKIKLIHAFKRTACKVNENTYCDIKLKEAKMIDLKNERIIWD